MLVVLVGGVIVVAAVAAEPVVPPAVVPATWELEWRAPAECPDAAAIREQVAALVPDPRSGEGVLHVDAKVEPRRDGFALQLRTEFFERHDAREAEARACEELVDVVALVVAISLDPSLDPTQRSPQLVVPPEPVVTPAASPEHHARATDVSSGVVARELPRRSRARRVPDAWSLRPAAQLEIGSLPRVGGGFDLALGLVWRWVRVELHGAYLWPRRAAGPRDSGGRFQLGLVGVRGCARPRIGRVELPVCLGVDGGAMRVDSEGIDPKRTLHGPWIAPTAGAGVAVGGARVGFWTLVEASAGVVRPQIHVGDASLFRTSVVSGRWLAGLEIFFAIQTR
ncbi:MAG TPA: hypothetical protein VG755_10350 [Nannocystaceae bacterium]|nr:hypothetical protein [Nannocystaceae bacterium]